MKKNLIFLALAAVALASCNGGFKKGPKGMLYSIDVDKSGTNIKNGDFVVFNLIGKNDADSVLFSTYLTGRPIQMVLQPRQPGEILDAFPYMSEGDSSTVKVLVDSVYKMPGQRPVGFKGKYIVYSIKIEKVIAKGTQTDAVFQGKVADYVKGEGEKSKNAEPAKIQKYIADNKLKVTTTSTGLNYVITQPGTGPLPNVGDTVSVNYVAKFINGKIFETTIKEIAVKEKTYNPMIPYQPIRLPVGQQKVIPGWDQGLMLLNKGAKATFVIPSSLAYGDRGYQSIAPYTPVVFDVEVTAITPVNPNAPKPTAPKPAVIAPVKK